MRQPVPKTMPVNRSGGSGQVFGDIYNDALPIFVHERVLEEVLEFSETEVSREIGGFLVGGFHEDGRRYVEVRHFLPAHDVRSRVASLTFTHETWATMTREVETKFPDEVVIGWHHTHPNFGVFLSGYDLFVQRNFFNQMWQIAMVVDAVRQEFGFFQWRGEEIVDCGFVCIVE